ncbi:hypothetical protein D0Z08_17540 [Nocardioides immobilis]|uniref:Uncharacterized protein n=1 Tax=Nocardioides immobilis TaxID=2049295 RepID=A0A417XZP0_9ACTN|nr:hypothetical protein D0Z08_17540 [Nocardioides immobilis]
MALRAGAAPGMIEATKQLRRVSGPSVPARAAGLVELEQHVAAETVGADCNSQGVSATLCTPGRHRSSFNRTELGTCSRESDTAHRPKETCGATTALASSL